MTTRSKMPISMATVMALMTLCGTVLGITLAMAMCTLGMTHGSILGMIPGITLLGMAGILTVMGGMATVGGGMATVGDTPVILPPSVITMVGMPIT